MAGVYIHIPFCKKACYYCDFHFTTNAKYHDRMVDAICIEISLKKDVLQSINPTTIYFGGGTPSILNKDQFKKIFDALDRYIDFDLIEECTIEANPDDIHLALLDYLKTTPITRFSLGIQSFHEADLQLMNRAHTATEAMESVRLIKAAGFNSFTLDLIYGMPESNDQLWRANIQQVIALKPDHISAYCLTIEPDTVLDRWQKSGKMNIIPDQLGVHQFKILIEELANANFEHYEISNFAQSGKRAKHNSNYWNGAAYVGIGPSAHSYDPIDASRTWNVANNIKYMDAIEEGFIPSTSEELSQYDQFNEYLMIRLRTSEGIDIKDFRNRFSQVFLNEFETALNTIDSTYYIKNNERIQLTVEGKLMSDTILSDLFIVE